MLVRPGPESAVKARPEELVERLSLLSATIDSLQAELRGDGAAGERLDELVEKLQASLRRRSACEETLDVSDETLTQLREEIDQLACQLAGQVDASACSTNADSPSGSTDAIARDRRRLDNLMADLQSDQSAAVGENSGALASAGEHTQWERLIGLSHSLQRHVQSLEDRAQELDSNWQQLQREQLELEAQRRQMAREREEMDLRREALDAETADLTQVYAQLTSILPNDRVSSLCEQTSSGYERSEQPDSDQAHSDDGYSQPGQPEQAYRSHEQPCLEASPDDVPCSDAVSADHQPTTDDSAPADAESFDGPGRNLLSPQHAACHDPDSKAESSSRSEAVRELDELLRVHGIADEPDEEVAATIDYAPSEQQTHSHAESQELTLEFEDDESFDDIPLDEDQTLEELPANRPGRPSGVSSSDSGLNGNRTSERVEQFQVEPSEEDARDGDQVLNLRSQLADLFGIAPTSQHQSEGGAGDTISRGRGHTEPEEFPAPEETFNDGSLSATIAAPPDRCAAPLPEVESAETRGGSLEADPIRDYMEQLIARNRKSFKRDGDAAEPPSVPTSSAATTDPPNDVPSEPASESEADGAPKKSKVNLDWLTEAPRHQQDKDAVRANMKALRQLANQTARTAVVKAGRKQLRSQVLTKAGAAAACWLIGIGACALGLPHMYGYVVIGVGCMFAGDLLIAVVRNRLRSASHAKLAKQSKGSAPRTFKVDPRTEGRLEQFTRAEHNHCGATPAAS